MTERASSGSTWLKVAFGVSLAANLFLIGLIGGQVFSAGDDEATKRANARQGYSLHPRVMMQALPEGRHDDIRAFYADARQGMGQKWRGINALRRDIDAALRAEPFDLGALRAAQAREAEGRMAIRVQNNDDIAAFLATLSHEDRTAIADLALSRLEEQTRYWRERRVKREAEGQ